MLIYEPTKLCDFVSEDVELSQQSKEDILGIALVETESKKCVLCLLCSTIRILYTKPPQELQLHWSTTIICLLVCR
jgi:hypothetical protein